MHARIMCMYVVCWLRCLRKLIARARGVYVIRLFIFIVVNSPLWRPHLKFSWRRFPLSHSHSHYIVYDIFRLPRAPLHKWKLAPFICVLIKRTEVCILLEAHNHAQLTSPSHVSRFQNLWCTDDRRPLPARRRCDSGQLVKCALLFAIHLMCKCLLWLQIGYTIRQTLW